MPPLATTGIDSPGGGRGDQDEAADVVLAGVSRALEPIDAHRVDAEFLRLHRVADAGALVNHLDARRGEGRHVRFGTAAGGFDHLDAARDRRVAVLVVGDRVDARQDREVDAERPVGHVATARDLLLERFGCRLGERGEEAEGSRVRRGRDEVRGADRRHPAAHDGMIDAEHAGEACRQGHGGNPSSEWRRGRRRDGTTYVVY